MPRTPHLGGLLASVLITTLLAPASSGQVGGVSREQMWPAPTAEDWKRPCLISWQRTWSDAVALSKATGRPILICVNMDGEIASEHYAGIRYRDPAIAELYKPYVTVIASVYRHNPRDFDETGQRILCPRFGSVTCGEHIAIEPVLYQKFFDGKRIAPRHIMVELDGKETYDIFYALDTASVFAAVAKGIAERKLPTRPLVKGDRSLEERVASPDNADRTAIEKSFVAGNHDQKLAILEAAVALGDKAPREVLRLALFGLDEDLARMARDALAKTNSPRNVELIAEALQAPLGDDERAPLIQALERLGKSSPRARTLATVNKGLGDAPATVDSQRWAQGLQGGGSYAPAPGSDVFAQRLESLDESVSSGDPKRLLDLAEAFLAQAESLSPDRPGAPLTIRALLSDALDAAKRAQAAGAQGWKLERILTAVHYNRGELQDARKHAVEAMRNPPENPRSWDSMVVLGLFAEARREAIRTAVLAGKDWPAAWLRDLDATYDLLAKHPHGDDTQVAAHVDFLTWLRAWRKARRALVQGLERFPASPLLHDRFRLQVLRSQGFRALEGAYARLLARPDAHPMLPWFAGYATLVAAEFHRRKSEYEEALKAYDRAITRFERAIAKMSRDVEDSSRHFIAMAHAGKARVAYEIGDDAAALEELLAAFKTRMRSANILDGLNISAVDTAKMLRARLQEKKDTTLLPRLEEALGRLDPDLLALPAYEGKGPRGSRPSRKN
ncbi:MAG TPA: hypothetical protein ENK43_08645 [Planctomycetes bacterium]|nr:hypothetical protein [Planctomycetota bacterium]